MYAQVEMSKENKSKAVANSVAQKKNGMKNDFGFVDNRLVSLFQRKMQTQISDSSYQLLEKKEHNTGLPNDLKTPIHQRMSRTNPLYLLRGTSNMPVQLGRKKKNLTPKQEANRQRLLEKRNRRFQQNHLYNTFGKSADELRAMMINSPQGTQMEYIKRKYIEQNDIEQRAKQNRHERHVMSLWPEYRDLLYSLRFPLSNHNDEEMKKRWNVWFSELQEQFVIQSKELYSKFKEDAFRNSVRDWISKNVITTLKKRGYYEETTLAKECTPPEEWNSEITEKRAQVDAVLENANSGIRAAFPGAKLKYRGSLATGWRNYTKSENGKAQRMNTQNFDVDAFIEIPDNIWQTWVNAELVLNQELKRKVDLSTLLIRIPHILRKNHQLSKQVFVDTIFLPLTSADSRLTQLKEIETKLILALSSILGYKLEMPGVGDMHFMLQPVNKSIREMKAGNQYPLGEMAKAGRKQTELMLDMMKGKHEVSDKEMLFAVAPEVQKEITTDSHEKLKNELEQAFVKRNVRKMLNIKPKLTEVEDAPLKLQLSMLLFKLRVAQQNAGPQIDDVD